MPSNYPMGAEFDPNAPWNEVEIPEMEIEVTITQVITKTVTRNVRADYHELTGNEQDEILEQIASEESEYFKGWEMIECSAEY